MIILESPKKDTIQHIFHISDVHIRLFQRMNEYDVCFQRLYKKLKDRKYGKKNIIVLTGDIVHSKNELSPECDMVTFDFLRSLSRIYPTFLIAGNHDALLNNRNRMDTLSSILHERSCPQLYFLKDTDVFQYKNIYFYVDSLLDDKSLDMTTKCSPDGIHIGLFHGSIVGWRNTKGYVSDHGEKYMEEFSGLDYVLLGDIHMFQYMSTKEPIAAYAGSLISQNFGETEKEHGFLVWDLVSTTQEHVCIENPYRHQDVYLLENDQVLTDRQTTFFKDAKIAPFGQVKVYSTPDELYSRDIFHQLQRIYKSTTFHFHVSSKKTDSSTDMEYFSMENDINCLRNFINSAVPIEYRDELFSFLVERWKDAENGFVPIQWDIKRILFSNMFGYGSDNLIHFGNHRDKLTIGVFGPNSVGKSTLIDIISTLLFDKVTRFSHGQTIPKEVIHFQETQAWGHIEIQIGNELYSIQKTYKRQTNSKIKQTTKFFKIQDGEKLELTGEQRKKTNTFIEQIIGKYDIFIYVNSYLQQREQSFRDLTSSSKKKFLNELYGYQWFSTLEKERKDVLKHLNSQYKLLEQQYKDLSEKCYDKSTISSNLTTLENEIQSLKTKHKKILVEKENLLQTIHFTKTLYEEKKHTIDNEYMEKKKEYDNVLQKEMESIHYLNQWENHFLVSEWETLSQCPIFRKWNPTVTTKDKWTLFYDPLNKSVLENQISLDSVRQQICYLLRNLNNTVFHVDSNVLQMFPIKEHSSLVQRHDSLRKEESQLQKHIRDYYNQMHFSMDVLLKSDHYYDQTMKEYEETIDSKNVELHHQQKKMLQFEHVIAMNKKENIPQFLGQHTKWKDHSLYQSLSPFYNSKRKTWERCLEKLMLIQERNPSLLRKEMKQRKVHLQRLEEDYRECPSGTCLSVSNYKQEQKNISQKPYTCLNCSLVWNSMDDDVLRQLEKLEADKYFIQTEMKMIREMICEIQFQPNPKCQVCLNNEHYKLKLQRVRKLKRKEKELADNDKKLHETYLYFQDRFQSFHDDVHFGKIRKFDLSILLEKKKEKETCIQKSTKEHAEFNSSTEKLASHENYKKKRELELQITTLHKTLDKLQDEYDTISEYLENVELYRYLELQWKWSAFLPKTMSEVEVLCTDFLQTYSERQQQMETVRQELLSLKEKQTQFKQFWKQDCSLVEKIQTCEERLTEKQNLETWLVMYDNFVQNKQREEQQTELERLQKIEIELKLYHDHKKTFHHLCEIWGSPSLWDVDGSDVVQKLQECRETMKDTQKYIGGFMEYESQYRSESKRMEEQWKKDLTDLDKISDLEHEQITNEQCILSLESQYIQSKCELESILQLESSKKEHKQKLVDVKNDISKEHILCQLVEKDGLPLHLLRNKMEQMERQMNELISPFLPGKRIRFFIEDKSIEFGVVPQENSTHLCNYFGGMESFIIELVVKLTFAKFSILPRSNFFIIDEGISVLDQNHIANISCLFQFLSHIVTNVLLISHLPQIQDFVDKSIYISKTNEKSHVQFQNST